MPLRTPSKSLSDTLHRIQPGLRIEWDNVFAGWRFVLNGFRNPALLHHADGVLVENLSVDETVELWYRGRTSHPEWLRQEHQRELRRKAREAREERKAREAVSYETDKVLDQKFHPRAYSFAQQKGV